jgi:transcription-repair coupling factor (superfamily II helicase)
MLIPNSYVSETAERLALYRKLDEIKDESELQKFTAEVTDRFGPFPPLVHELLEAIRLRWLGQRMGLEKMVLKKGTLIGTFIADQKHPFFEGDAFQSVLRAVQAQPRRFKVYEKAGTLRISVQDVKNVQGAKAALEGVVGTPVVSNA